MYLKILFCIISVHLVSSAPVVPFAKRCLPEQWEGIGYAKIAQSPPGENATIVPMKVKISYDLKNKRVTNKQTVLTPTAQVLVHVYEDWSKQIAYVAYPQQQTCTNTKLPSDSMKQYCEGDPDLMLIDSFLIGDKMADMYETAWNGAKSSFTALRDDFILVSNMVEQIYSGVPQMIAYQYGNVTLGIKDPSVFNIPEYCKKQE